MAQPPYFKALEIAGWAPAIEGMRAPLKSYDKSDSTEAYYDTFVLGEKDYNLAKSLCQAGPEHRKWMRQIQVWAKFNLPLYLHQEVDTYHIGVTKNSESTMHTLMKENLTFDNFDTKYMDQEGLDRLDSLIYNLNTLIYNYSRCDNGEAKEKLFITIKSLLPSSFIQSRYVNLNYEVLHNMYHQRKNHRLPQWSNDFVSWIHSLPCSEFITNEWNV